MGWRGASVAKGPTLPLVRTAISSQRAAPTEKGALPKSSATVNRPLVTGMPKSWVVGDTALHAYLLRKV